MRIEAAAADALRKFHGVTNRRNELRRALILMSVLVRISDIVRTLSHFR